VEDRRIYVHLQAVEDRCVLNKGVSIVFSWKAGSCQRQFRSIFMMRRKAWNAFLAT